MPPSTSVTLRSQWIPARPGLAKEEVVQCFSQSSRIVVDLQMLNWNSIRGAGSFGSIFREALVQSLLFPELAATRLGAVDEGWNNETRYRARWVLEVVEALDLEVENG